MQFGFKHTIRYNNIWKSFEEMKNEKIPVLDHSIDIVAGADQLCDGSAVRCVCNHQPNYSAQGVH
jgi:hypothetical protein